MANSGIRHVVSSVPVTKTAYEAEDHHALIHGTSFPGSPVERQLYYRDDLHAWYIYNGSSWVSLQAAAIDKLDDIGDVSVPSPADDDLLYYDAGSGLWKCRKLVDADIPAAIARDAEVAALLAALEFTDLADTPASYSGQAAKAVRVNAAANALEFFHDLWTPAIYTSEFAWPSLDGCTTSIPSGGSADPNLTAVVLASGVTLNNNTLIRSTSGYNAPFPSGKEVTIEFPLSYRSGTANHRFIFLWINDTTLPPVETNDHVGFIMDAGDLYSSSADDTAQETQDTGIDIGIGSFLYQCRVVIDPGVSAKFYVNNVLKTTHTTRPPRADTPTWAVLCFGVKTTAAGEDQKAAWERILITKEL